MTYVFMHGACINCSRPISFAPGKVPSIRYQGVKEPLCSGCFARWNQLHRTSKGLEPLPEPEGAYEPQLAEEYLN